MATKRLAFPKARRLMRPGEFDRVKREGRTQGGRFMVLAVRYKTVGAFRAGFVTSRTVGRAVSRNRVRRRLREVVRKHQSEIVSGVWLVTIARSAAANASCAQLEAEWLRLAGRASILAA